MWCCAPAIPALILRLEISKFKVGREGKSGKGGEERSGRDGEEKRKGRGKGGKLVKKCFGLRKLSNFEKEKLIINQKKIPQILLLNDSFFYQYKSMKKIKIFPEHPSPFRLSGSTIPRNSHEDIN